MDPWLLTYEGWDPRQERLREALCTLGNGYMATRGAGPDASADGVRYPGTYAAGVYNRLTSEVEGREIENESLVNLPNWLELRIAVQDEPWFDVAETDVLEYRQELDIRHGVLTRLVRFRVPGVGTTRLSERRIVHIEHEHVAALQIAVLAEDWSGRLRIRSGIDGSVENAGVERYRSLAGDHLVVRERRRVCDDTVLLVSETNQSRIRIAQAARTSVAVGGDDVDVTWDVDETDECIAIEAALDVKAGRETAIEKVVTTFTSRDRAISEPSLDAVLSLQSCACFEELLDRHLMGWAQMWDRFRVALDIDHSVLRTIRLHIFHLLQTVSHNSIPLDVGVPPRGLHGEAYRGLIMWDELFAFPVLNLRLPALTRALLGYRFRRLPAARRAAHEAGYDGAMFPWQSGSNGQEMAQRLHLNPRSGRWLPDPTHLQRHIGLAVGYNVVQYYEATGDWQYLADQGAEMTLQIARFFASLASYDHARDRYNICGVVGPDEFHTGYPWRDEPGLDNNAYTNVLAAWLLRRAPELLEPLPEGRRSELKEALGLGRAELERWAEISRKLTVPFHDGVISQFEDYDKLEELDWEGLRQRHGNIHRLDRVLESEDDDTNRYKASKQADVVMLFYLFSADELREQFETMGYELPHDMIPRTVEYYTSRTTHGSTLSALVHTWVMARSHREQAFRYFGRVLESDIADIQGGTTEEGIHLGAMAGSVDLLQRCFSGLEVRGDTLTLNPYWPQDMGRLSFDILYRGHPLTLLIRGNHVRVSSMPGRRDAVTVSCRGEEATLRPGTTVEFPGDGGGG